MHQLLIGVEHLMTGVQVSAMDPEGSPTGGVLTFERESASIVRVLCDQPILAYWPVKQLEIHSTEVTDYEPVRHGYGEAEWCAQVMASAMRKADSVAIDNYHSRQRNDKAPPLPDAVILAMRRKHGAQADSFISALQWDGLNGCWCYEHAGMYLGVEQDGYIHS